MATRAIALCVSVELMGWGLYGSIYSKEIFMND